MTARAQRLVVQGEEIELPARIYNPELSSHVTGRLSPVQRLIAACAYSRHHDGYVRQASCAALLPAREPWIVPYVVQQLGEYVVEIYRVSGARGFAQSPARRSELTPGLRSAPPSPRRALNANHSYVLKKKWTLRRITELLEPTHSAPSALLVSRGDRI